MHRPRARIQVEACIATLGTNRVSCYKLCHAGCLVLYEYKKVNLRNSHSTSFSRERVSMPPHKLGPTLAEATWMSIACLQCAGMRSRVLESMEQREEAGLVRCLTAGFMGIMV